MIRDQMAELAEGRAALALSDAGLRRVTDVLPVLIAFIDKHLVYRFANLQAWYRSSMSQHGPAARPVGSTDRRRRKTRRHRSALQRAGKRQKIGRGPEAGRARWITTPGNAVPSSRSGWHHSPAPGRW
ncbi:hypothetical protein [Xanthomonas sp. 3793]|uniref:hypothetical protein n=1 Tax=Xanthomonas sp. 3793 TaxID=3035312 RepID=UPI002169E4AF|nr:hypothetical protein [Xanthomonas sp. 3793]